MYNKVAPNLCNLHQVNPHYKGECSLLFDSQDKLDENELCTTYNHWKRNEQDKTPLIIRHGRMCDFV